MKRDSSHYWADVIFLVASGVAIFIASFVFLTDNPFRADFLRIERGLAILWCVIIPVAGLVAYRISLGICKLSARSKAFAIVILLLYMMSLLINGLISWESYNFNIYNMTGLFWDLYLLALIPFLLIVTPALPIITAKLVNKETGLGRILNDRPRISGYGIIILSVVLVSISFIPIHLHGVPLATTKASFFDKYDPLVFSNIAEYGGSHTSQIRFEAARQFNQYTACDSGYLSLGEVPEYQSFVSGSVWDNTSGQSPPQFVRDVVRDALEVRGTSAVYLQYTEESSYLHPEMIRMLYWKEGGLQVRLTARSTVKQKCDLSKDELIAVAERLEKLDESYAELFGHWPSTTSSEFDRIEHYLIK